jgi:hypothetical protein
MPWWGWVLIGIAVVIGGVVKVKVLNRWMARRKASSQEPAED